MAFLAVSWVYFKILRIALDKNLVDNPDARKLQKRPIPVLGGIAVFFGVLGGVLSGAVAYALVGDPSATRLLPVLCAMSVMLYVGAMDDILGLTPRSRLVIEVLTMVGLFFKGWKHNECYRFELEMQTGWDRVTSVTPVTP